LNKLNIFDGVFLYNKNKSRKHNRILNKIKLKSIGDKKVKDKKMKKIFLNGLVVIIGLLYLLFIYMDVLNIQTFISSDILKYISIILCFIIVLSIGKDGFNNRDKFLLQFALVITVVADLCFLIFDYYILGIIFFCLVQIIYFIRHKMSSGYKIFITIIKFTITFLAIMIIYIMINLFIIKIDFLYGIALFYSICLCTSTIKAIQVIKFNLYPYPNKYMIGVGMALFLLCDINVAISSITKSSLISLHIISSLLIWIFYLPSQILLSMSGYDFRKIYY